MSDLLYKCNGLSGQTKFWEKRDGRYVLEYHEHPETHELVVMRTWYVLDGEDDVMPEFEVEAVYSPELCKISKAIANCQEHIKVSFDEFINSLK